MLRILLYILMSPFILIYYIIELFRTPKSQRANNGEEISKLLKEIENEENIKSSNQIKLQKIMDKYEKMMSIIEVIETDEILEYLIEFEKLDEIMNEFKEYNYKPMSDARYKEFKNYKLITKFQMKFNKINSGKNKIEKIKSLIDEIETCKRRSPQYSDVFDSEIELLNNTLNRINYK